MTASPGNPRFTTLVNEYDKLLLRRVALVAGGGGIVIAWARTILFRIVFYGGIGADRRDGGRSPRCSGSTR